MMPAPIIMPQVQHQQPVIHQNPAFIYPPAAFSIQQPQQPM